MNEQEQTLEALETVINVNQPDFYAVGKALGQIKHHRLYRFRQFTRFETYLQQRWDMGRCYAYRLIAAAEVIDQLSPIGNVLPQNEAQARPLTQLPPDQLKPVWRAFTQTYDEFNAHTILQFIKDRNHPKPQKNSTTPNCSEDYQSAVMQLLQQIALAQTDRWQSTSRQAALYWHQVMKDKITIKVTHELTGRSISATATQKNHA